MGELIKGQLIGAALVLVGFGLAAQAQQHPVYTASNVGRYIIYQSPITARDQYLLDTQTGLVRQNVIGAVSRDNVWAIMDSDGIWPPVSKVR